MLKRRSLLTMAAACALSIGGRSALALSAEITPADLRGAIDAHEFGVVPGASDNQSRALQALIDKSAERNIPVYLPPGDYNVSNLELRNGTRLCGTAGASRIVYGGDGHLLRADGVGRVELCDLVIDGANRWLADYTQSLIALRGVAEVLVDNCEIAGSAKNALQLERCGGRIERSRISGAADAAIYAVESTGLSITANRIADCGNGGILVHRWTKGADGTMVSGNRIARIKARDGGTGQHGNGINLFRADNVMVQDNHISDCAFSAIRANAASNVQIDGNQCLSSGETAIYAEFGFEGALVSANLIDGAANGILVVNFDEGGRLAVISGNIVRNLSLTGPYIHDGAGFGFGISAEADTVISGNVIENAPKWGIVLGWGPYLRNLVASGNIIRNAPVGIAVSVVEGAGGAVIADNLFDQTPDGAILGFRWKEKASNDLIAGAPDFSHLTISANRLI
ncbi:MAG: TIGR03808 family TAT-translocated repetitive protein [Allorhizobium sp.]